ncbi:Bifunctional autolysin precursor [Jeotgalicoccus saudimassiliensis]|uniref:Bifunctional autolysin n=1 Tax=Jeotgalicoccus saudimassiliensis TaxID=1461582 RepID=A0A078M596_9STAP|nr:N-acetylglucosaminidase [Jeotgalicoccus saudimassiliensis]CEA01500.1 Bifunctional autolysin precursor [Jeotgalicoccus saudimassiliensis]
MERIKENIPFILLIIVMALFTLAFFVSETSFFKTEEISTYTFEEAVSMQVNNNTGDVKLTGSMTEYADENDIKEAMSLENSSNFQFVPLDTKTGAGEEELNTLLEGKGILEGTGRAFMEAERRHNINALYLISHALLETGHGQSELASGIPVEGTTYYNFFGIGAFDHDAIAEGSSYARAADWSSPETAIIGGAEFIRTNYLDGGQNTLYRMRWNPANPGTHLYATDIAWAEKIASIMHGYYDMLGLEYKELDTQNYNNQPE